MIYFLQFFFILIIFSSQMQVLNPGSESSQKQQYTYSVEQTDQPPAINAKWKKKFWNNTNIVRLENYIKDYPTHFPETQAKLKYDKENIYIIFYVKDRYVKAVAKEINGRVWEDSCVEFFFTPGPDVSRGYFNLETNCKGIFLLQFHKGNGKGQGFVDLEDAGQIIISHSLEKNVENEIVRPLDWTIEYKIPISILSEYMEVDYPEAGVKWRANFYKCGDKTSHPHWIAWAPIVHPKPNFHLPEFFGWLEFK